MFPFHRLITQVQLTWRLLRDNRIPFWKKLIPFFGFLYVIMPIDIIPDFLVVVGQLDDLGIIIFSMQIFERAIDPMIVEEHRAALEGRAPENLVITTEDYTISSPGEKPKRKPKRG